MDTRLEKQVSSLELSKQLKELGVKQESLFYWQYFHDTDDDGRMSEYKLYNIDNLYSGKDDGYSAFTVAELGEMLPKFIWYKNLKEDDKKNYHLYIKKLVDCWLINYLWNENGRFISLGKEQVSKTEADARAKMLIYLIENKLMDIKNA